MEKVWVFIVSFISIYLLYLFTVVIRKSKMENYKKSVQIVYFIKKYNLQFNKISITKFANIIALSNSFIISLTMVIVEFVDNFLLKLLVAVVVLTPLILIVYAIIGKYIKAKEGK